MSKLHTGSTLHPTLNGRLPLTHPHPSTIQHTLKETIVGKPGTDCGLPEVELQATKGDSETHCFAERFRVYLTLHQGILNT